MTDAGSPHKAIIFVSAEVHDLLPTGECSGRIAFEIKRFPMMIDGMNKGDTIKRLNETLEGLKATCRSQCDQS